MLYETKPKTRTRYSVAYCTPQERDAGTEHYDEYDTKAEAIAKAKELDPDNFIAVEERKQEYRSAPAGKRYKDEAYGWWTTSIHNVDYN